MVSEFQRGEPGSLPKLGYVGTELVGGRDPLGMI
jgi:hypothetical protein